MILFVVGRFMKMIEFIGIDGGGVGRYDPSSYWSRGLGDSNKRLDKVILFIMMVDGNWTSFYLHSNV